MPETIHCRVCGKAIRVDGFADQMKKIRHHYKREHPRLWRKSIKHGVTKRKLRG